MRSNDYIAEKLLEIKAVVIANEDNLFTWASGIKSPIYCDNRLIMAYPEFRKYVAEEFTKKIKNLGIEIDVIVGTATAGIAHAAWVAERMDKPLAYVRSSSKAHGKKNQIEGIVREGQTAVVIEDLLSTGGSALSAVKALKEAGANVVKVFSIFNYNFDELVLSFASELMSYESLTDYKTLLPIAKESGYITDKDYEVLKLWSENPKMFTK
ncbi:MAG: orotate phosphoribosyltransferase [Clostridiales bacterium]|nr:orotate phosphoribosyltransferase [Clostridiales bacterium]